MIPAAAQGQNSKADGVLVLRAVDGGYRRIQLGAPPEAAALKALAKRSVSTGLPKLGSDPKRLNPPPRLEL